MHFGLQKHYAESLVIKFNPPNITLDMQITVSSKKRKEKGNKTLMVYQQLFS